MSKIKAKWSWDLNYLTEEETENYTSTVSIFPEELFTLISYEEFTSLLQSKSSLFLCIKVFKNSEDFSIALTECSHMLRACRTLVPDTAKDRGQLYQQKSLPFSQQLENKTKYSSIFFTSQDLGLVTMLSPALHCILLCHSHTDQSNL